MRTSVEDRPSLKGAADLMRVGCAIAWLVVSWAASMFSGLPLLLLPVAIAAAFVMISPLRRDHWENPGLVLFLGVAGIRYVLIPTYMIVVSALGFSDFPFVSDRAVLLMAYEQIIVLLTLRWVVRRRYSSAGSSAKRSALMPYRGQALWLVVLAAAASIIVFPGVLDDYNLVGAQFSGSVAEHSASGVHGAVHLIVLWGRLLLPLLVISILTRRLGSERRTTYLISVGVLLVVNLAIFKGVDRQSALVPGVASLFYLLSLFPNRKRITVAVMAAGLLVSFFMMTAFKADYISVSSGSTQAVLTVSTVEAYFNGFSNLEVSLQALELYRRDYSLRTMANDILGNFPGARMDLANRTTAFYNLAYYGGGSSGDQIIPMSGQAIFYGGLALFWIPLVLVVLLVAEFDKRYRASTNTLDSFLYSLGAVVTGMAFMLNLMIVAAHVYTLVLPGMLILAVFRSRASRARGATTGTEDTECRRSIDSGGTRVPRSAMESRTIF